MSEQPHIKNGVERLRHRMEVLDGSPLMTVPPEVIREVLTRLEQAEQMNASFARDVNDLKGELESLRTRFAGMRAGRDSERSRADKNANKLEQAEQTVLRVREAVKDAPTSDPTRGFAGPPDDYPDIGDFIGNGEWAVAERVRRALDGDGRG